MDIKIEDILKLIAFAFLFVFWSFGSEALVNNPNLTMYVLTFSWAMLTIVSIIVQIVLKESIKSRMERKLTLEIKEMKEEMNEELKELISYLETTKYPTYGESNIEGIESAFQEFDSIKSRYLLEPKILRSTILVVIASLILILFLMNPYLFQLPVTSPYATQPIILTLAHVGMTFLGIGLAYILSMLFTLFEAKFWE